MTKAQARKKSAASEAIPSDDTGRTSILVVEDEHDLQELLRYNLIREGFTVQCTDSGETALSLVQTERPELILLDLMLPGMDGLEVCRNIKTNEATASIPIVMLTAKGEEADVVLGLEMGADDYVTKPFSPRVLSARIKAVLRRPATEAPSDSAALQVGPIRILPDRHEVLIDGKPAQMTATEFRLLHLMARKPGRVFTRQQIIDALHDGFAAVTDRSVDVQIVSLRRKLGEAEKLIQTVRGVGYRLGD
ncbi:MAG: response regulator [Phycisphaeraceae bacterium]|nr:response regulator [Phycisphaeraceae bacterium]